MYTNRCFSVLIVKPPGLKGLVLVEDKINIAAYFTLGNLHSNDNAVDYFYCIAINILIISNVNYIVTTY